jgi:biotin carboxyl carrier protein
MLRIVGVVGLTWTLTAGAATVDISDALLERYGATLANPVADSAAVVLTAEGYVVAPPASERVVIAHTAGIVEQVLVSTGATVAAGTPLVRVGGGGVVGLQLDYLTAVRAEQRARAQLDRDTALHADGIVSDRRLQESRDALATSAVAREQFAVALEPAGIDDGARKTLADTGRAQPAAVLRAPQAGTVTEIGVRPGEQVDPERPVARIVDLEQLWLELRVTPDDSRRLHAGMLARQPGASAPIGNVIAVLPVVDEHSQTALVRIALQAGNPAALGAFMAVELLQSGTIDAAGAATVRIPARSLLRDGQRAEVFVVSGTRLEPRPVEVVGENRQNAWVTGLVPRDRIVVAGTAALRALLAETGAPADDGAHE